MIQTPFRLRRTPGWALAGSGGGNRALAPAETRGRGLRKREWTEWRRQAANKAEAELESEWAAITGSQVKANA
jgi:hypothetical protein